MKHLGNIGRAEGVPLARPASAGRWLTVLLTVLLSAALTMRPLVAAGGQMLVVTNEDGGRGTRAWPVPGRVRMALTTYSDRVMPRSHLMWECRLHGAQRRVQLGGDVRQRAFPLRVTAGLVALGALAWGTTVPATAHDGADTTTYGIVSAVDYFAPDNGLNDDVYNGRRVFLSSPRHTDSGGRGECMNPGRQENENGRGFNWRAANGNYVGSTYTTTNRSRNLHSRGYYVLVGPNTKDGGVSANVTLGRNFGANIYIITHTNASTGCSSGGNYMMTMWEHTNDQSLAGALGGQLDAGVPGTWSNVQRTNLEELEANVSNGDVYVELQFHDNQTTQSWLYNQAHTAAWRYGLGVDVYLGYP